MPGLGNAITVGNKHWSRAICGDLRMLTGLHAGLTRAFCSAVPASGLGFWVIFCISCLEILLCCAITLVWLSVTGRLYLTYFILRLALTLSCPSQDLCCPELAPVGLS